MYFLPSVIENPSTCLLVDPSYYGNIIFSKTSNWVNFKYWSQLTGKKPYSNKKLSFIEQCLYAGVVLVAWHLLEVILTIACLVIFVFHFSSPSMNMEGLHFEVRHGHVTCFGRNDSQLNWCKNWFVKTEKWMGLNMLSGISAGRAPLTGLATVYRIVSPTADSQ